MYAPPNFEQSLLMKALAEKFKDCVVLSRYKCVYIYRVSRGKRGVFVGLRYRMETLDHHEINFSTQPKVSGYVHTAPFSFLSGFVDENALRSHCSVFK